MGDGLLLHRGVHDDARHAGLVDGAELHRRHDGGLEQQLHALLAEQAAEAAQLSGATGQERRVVLVAREVLPNDVLAQALHEFFVRQAVGVLQIQQRGHDAEGATGVGDAASHELGGGAEELGSLDPAAGAALVREQRRDGGFDLCPGQARAQDDEAVAGIDHAVQPRAKKVVGGHGFKRSIVQKSNPSGIETGRSGHRR